MKRVLVLLLILLYSYSLFGQSIKEIENEFKSKLNDKIFSLKHFYLADHQVFDANGKMTNDEEIGIWNLYSTLKVSSVKLTDHSIHIEGTRVYLDFRKDGNRHVNHLTAMPLLIDVEVAEPKDKPAYAKAWNQLILNIGGDLNDLLAELKRLQETEQPVIWNYVHTFPNPKSNDDKDATDSKPIRVSEITLGTPIVSTKPIYPYEAKVNRIQGSVVFNAFISTQGKVKNLRLIHSAGGGLDEAAFDAVCQWKYKPYKFHDQPFETETTITVKFEMGR